MEDITPKEAIKRAESHPDLIPKENEFTIVDCEILSEEEMKKIYKEFCRSSEKGNEYQGIITFLPEEIKKGESNDDFQEQSPL